MTLKLCDFSLCLNMREERSVTRAGTLDYMAPEVLRCPPKEEPQDNKSREDLSYTTAVDIWSVGIVAYELLNGLPPFTRRDREETERLILKGAQPPFMVHASDMAEDFIYSCLTKKPQQRPSAWQLLRYPWAKMTMRSSSSQQFTSLGSQLQMHSASAETQQQLSGRPGLAPRPQEACALHREIQHEGEEQGEADQEPERFSVPLPHSTSSSSAAPKAPAAAPARHVPLSEIVAKIQSRKQQQQRLQQWTQDQARASTSQAAAARIALLPETAGPSVDRPSTSTSPAALNADKRHYLASVMQTDLIAAERRAGRIVQKQQSFPHTHRSSDRSQAHGAVPPSSAQSGDHKSDTPSSPVQMKPVERSYSDLSRHTTDAGYRSATRSRRSSAANDT